MTHDEAEKLARKLKAMFANGMRSEEHDMNALCDHILSGDHKREIENAAYRRAGKVARRFGCGVPGCTHCYAGAAAEKILALIQPSAQKEDGK